MSEGSDSLPTGWQRIALGTAANVEVGGTPSTDIPRFWGGDIPWMSSGEVHQYRIYDVQGRITEIGLQSSNAKLVDPPAVAIALAGQGKTRGTVALTQIRVCTNQSVALMQGHSGTLDSAFLFHNLDARYEELRASSAGGGRAGLSKKILETLPIELPILIEEQQAIAHILDTIDEAIATTTALIDKLKLAKAGLLHDLLTRGIDENGELRDPTRHPEQFKDSELGLIPNDWDVRTCNSLCTEIVVGIVIRPSQYYQRQGVPVFRSANVREEGLDPSDLVFMSDKSNLTLSKSMVRTGNVLTVRTGYPGTSCVVPPEWDGCNCVDLIISRPTPEVDSDFLALWINSDFGKGQVLRSQGGLAQQHFNVGELKKLLVVLPSPQEQQGIQDILNAYEDKIKGKGQYRDKLKLLKQGLMSDLLTGRVRVKVDSSEAD